MPLFPRRLLALLLLLVLPLQLGSARAPQSPAAGWLYRGSDIPPDPAWQLGILPNGMRYAVRRNPLPVGQVSIRMRIETGSLNEADQERGWAHFVEHMAFRGTRNFSDGKARQIWQQLGAAFGSDTNATTDPGQTVYQLDLPRSDPASLDQSLRILAEMADDALFDPAAVEAERKIVLAEKRRRPELATRLDEVSRPLFYAGLKFAERDPIGTDETLRAATADRLRGFYERWYRPERATLVIVGDADPATIIPLVAKNFGGWKGSGAPPPEPDYGRIAARTDRAVMLAYPTAPVAASIMWLRPHVDGPDTVARTRDELAERLAAQIVNRRLEAKARGDAAFINAVLGVGRERRIADMTQLSISPKEGHWREALHENFAIIADALRTPPSEPEIRRELINLRRSLVSAVEGESTLRSQQWAQRLVNAVDDGEVMTSAPTMLALFDRLSPDMSPKRIGEEMKNLFSGFGPRLLLLTPRPVEGGQQAIDAGLASAEKAAPAVRQSDRTVSFDSLPPFGPPGKEISRQHIDDMGVTIVRFANGSTLTFKQTDFDKGSVLVRLRFGKGIAGLDPAENPPVWMSGAVAPSGLADLDLDAMERLLTGRRINLEFGVEEDSFALTGATNAEDLPDQLRLLTAKLAFPRWDAPLFNRFKSGWLENYELSFASASARARRELGAVTHSGDPRWQPVDKAVIAKADPADLAASFAPILAQGPVEAIVVGDIDLERTVGAMAATVGALPARPAPPAEVATDVRPPRPDRKPHTFTHEGDPNQAYALIGWSTFGGMDRIRQRRALSLAAEILEVRLFERLREAEGITYAPNAAASSSENFHDWGIFYAAAEIRPESVDTFFRIAREEIDRLARDIVPEEEFVRAQNPIVSGIERRLKTSRYWISTLENWTTYPNLIEQTRTYLSDYRGLTAEEVRAAVATFVADERDWSMLVLPDKAPDKAGADGN